MYYGLAVQSESSASFICFVRTLRFAYGLVRIVVCRNCHKCGYYDAAWYAPRFHGVKYSEEECRLPRNRAKMNQAIAEEQRFQHSISLKLGEVIIVPGPALLLVISLVSVTPGAPRDQQRADLANRCGRRGGGMR